MDVYAADLSNEYVSTTVDQPMLMCWYSSCSRLADPNYKSDADSHVESANPNQPECTREEALPQVERLIGRSWSVKHSHVVDSSQTVIDLV